jgi:hypothetical protein
MIDWTQRSKLALAAVAVCGIILAIFATMANPAEQTELQLSWATYLGGSQTDRGFATCIRADGSIVVVGGTSSADFPTTPGSFQPVYGGGASDGFITVWSAPPKP